MSDTQDNLKFAMAEVIHSGFFGAVDGDAMTDLAGEVLDAIKEAGGELYMPVRAGEVKDKKPFYRRNHAGVLCWAPLDSRTTHWHYSTPDDELVYVNVLDES